MKLHTNNLTVSPFQADEAVEAIPMDILWTVTGLFFLFAPDMIYTFSQRFI